jgi:hypothetical protein
MPLRDHFHPEKTKRTEWERVHGQWPAMIVLSLVNSLPPNYIAGPKVHIGPTIEIDVATLEQDEPAEESEEADTPLTDLVDDGNGGGVATAIWAPSKPTLSIRTSLPEQDIYEVRIYDEDQGTKLVAAIELVSPANKDRREHRETFVAKCASLLHEQVCVCIVDVVTSRDFNLYVELLDLIGINDPMMGEEPSAIYAVACRTVWKKKAWHLETWAYPLKLGQVLPTLPLWLTDQSAIPLELEKSYEETCRVLRIAQ